MRRPSLISRRRRRGRHAGATPKKKSTTTSFRCSSSRNDALESASPHQHPARRRCCCHGSGGGGLWRAALCCFCPVVLAASLFVVVLLVCCVLEAAAAERSGDEGGGWVHGHAAHLSATQPHRQSDGASAELLPGSTNTDGTSLGEGTCRASSVTCFERGDLCAVAQVERPHKSVLSGATSRGFRSVYERGTGARRRTLPEAGTSDRPT